MPEVQFQSRLSKFVSFRLPYLSPHAYKLDQCQVNTEWRWPLLEQDSGLGPFLRPEGKDLQIRLSVQEQVGCYLNIINTYEILSFNYVGIPFLICGLARQLTFRDGWLTS